MPGRGESVNPAAYPDEIFDLYSISAFDCREPEMLRGSEIGSTKQLVEPGDVMISKIVPHIRRAWVVGKNRGHRTIASSEWIVFRDKRIYPDFMRHLLVEDRFHAKFMSTVSGVGGSLLRARPAHVATIEISLPPLADQRRIAEVLDRAEALRAKRRAALAQLDILTQSIFIDVFGDPATNPKGWPVLQLHEVVKEGTIVTYGIVQAGEEFPGGVPYIRTGDIVGGEIVTSGLRHTDPEIAAKFSRSRVEAGDIVMSIRATVGTTALVPRELDGANLTQGTGKISPGKKIERFYLLNYLRASGTQHWIRLQIKGATFREITLTRLRELPVAVPPIATQREFARAVKAIEKLKTAHSASLAELASLFASLQHRAFRGEL